VKSAEIKRLTSRRDGSALSAEKLLETAGRRDCARFHFSDETRSGARVEYRRDGQRPVAADLAALQDAIPCFLPGTLLRTAQGPRPIESLVAGDRVVTRDGGAQAVVSVSRADFGWRQIGLNPYLRPVRIPAGALGNGLPERDLVLSRNHKLLVQAANGDESLMAARDLLGLSGVATVDVSSVSYLRLHLQRHEIVLAEGLWSESALPDGDTRAAARRDLDSTAA